MSINQNSILSFKQIPLIIAVLTLSFAQAQVSADTTELLTRMLGEKEIHARIWSQRDRKFIDTKGTATFSQILNGQYIREQFQLNLNNQVVKGMAYVRFSKAHSRFELIQVDEAAASSIVLNGHWDHELQQLVFVPLENYSQWGSKGTLGLRWSYTFRPDGSFVKEMYIPDEKKQYFLQSDYTYTSIAPKNISDKFKHFNIPTKGGTLHFQTIGRGRTIVINNGGPGWTCKHIESFGEKIAALGYRVVMYDQRGTGRSVLTKTDSVTVTVEHMLGDLETLRSHLNLKTWTVLGHSFGSILSALYAARFPNVIEKLVLLAPPGTDLTFLSDYQANLNMRLTLEERENISYWSAPERLAEQPERAAYEQVVNTLSAFVYDKSQLPTLRASINTKTYNINVAQLVWSDLFRINYDISHQLEQFKNKCLIVAGKQDALSQSAIERTAHCFPKSELVWLDECAHILWADQPTALYSTIGKFLDAE